MARYATLTSLLQDYRAEIGVSQNAAHNAADTASQVLALRKTQERLWRAHDWPHLRVRRTQPLQAGQRYYDTPDDMTIERLETIEVRYGQEWVLLCNGISREHYAAYDSDLDQRAWPAERWQVYEGEDFEVWPVPSDNADGSEGMLRLTGIRSLKPLVAPGDLADLDDDLIVKYAAAKYLARKGARDAQLVLDEAKRIELDLTGNFSKVKDFRLFDSAPFKRTRRGPPRVHYRTT